MHQLQPGETITGIDGVQVVAPLHWDAAGPITLKIERLNPQTLKNPVRSHDRLLSPVYRITTDVAVKARRGEKFQVHLPISTSLPDQEVRGLTFMVSFYHERTAWQLDYGAVTTNKILTFKRSSFLTLGLDNADLFTAVHHPPQR